MFRAADLDLTTSLLQDVRPKGIYVVELALRSVSEKSEWKSVNY